MQEGADRVLGSRHTRERWSDDLARMGRPHGQDAATPSSTSPSETARRSPLPDGGPNGSARAQIETAARSRNLRRYAAKLGLDVTRFDRDRIGGPVLDRVRRDERGGSGAP